MKKISRIFYALLCISIFISCNNHQKEEFIQEVDENSKFEESVAVIQNTYAFKDNSSSVKSQRIVLKVELVCFDDVIELSPVYKIDGVEYCDNGLFNDEYEGDGIYTSVEDFIIEETSMKSQFNNEIIINKSDRFRYDVELYEYISGNYIGATKTKLKIKIGCKVRWADCPNTNWLNTSLFGEKCIEFYDCEASAELELGG